MSYHRFPSSKSISKNNNERYPLDVIHVHYGYPHALSAALARQILERIGKKKPAVITTVHGTDVTVLGRDRRYKHIIRLGLELSDSITAVSNYLKSRTVSELGVTQVEVIPNFVRVCEYDPEILLRKFSPGDILAGLGWSSLNKVVLHVSNFRPIKRVDRVLKVFKGISERMSEARLLMIGDGPEKEKAVNMVKEMGLSDKVKFLPAQRDLKPYLLISSLFLLLSDEESFGMSALEAMAGGVPVIATKVGGLPEVIADNQSGFLIEPDNTEEQVSRALLLLQNEHLRRKFSMEARRRAMLFDAEKVVLKYEGLYRSLLV